MFRSALSGTSLAPLLPGRGQRRSGAPAPARPPARLAPGPSASSGRLRSAAPDDDLAGAAVVFKRPSDISPVIRPAPSLPAARSRFSLPRRRRPAARPLLLGLSGAVQFVDGPPARRPPAPRGSPLHGRGAAAFTMRERGARACHQRSPFSRWWHVPGTATLAKARGFSLRAAPTRVRVRRSWWMFRPTSTTAPTALAPCGRAGRWWGRGRLPPRTWWGGGRPPWRAANDRTPQARAEACQASGSGQVLAHAAGARLAAAASGWKKTTSTTSSPRSRCSCCSCGPAAGERQGRPRDEAGPAGSDNWGSV